MNAHDHAEPYPEPLTDRELAHEHLDAEELAEVYEQRGWRWGVSAS